MLPVRQALIALTLAAALSMSGCAYFVSRVGKEPAQPKAAVKSSEYERLAAKARKGDIDAARQLAKWCYQNDVDNERAKYWLQVAADHGDTAAAKAAGYVQDWR